MRNWINLSRSHCVAASLCLCLAVSAVGVADEGNSRAKAKPPGLGEKAPDFSLKSVEGETIKLGDLTRTNRVVLVVLRGYPGYQCPICNRQVAEFLKHANRFAAVDAQVVMIYPGPDAELQPKAREFLGERQLPKHFHMLIDPDYEFTNAYRLRWNAPDETAYPSTFVIDEENKVRFASVSQTHAGRASAEEILKVLEPGESKRIP